MHTSAGRQQANALLGQLEKVLKHLHWTQNVGDEKDEKDAPAEALMWTCCKLRGDTRSCPGQHVHKTVIYPVEED